MSEEIDERVESDQSKLFSQLNNHDSTFSVKGIIGFAHGLEQS